MNKIGGCLKQEAPYPYFFFFIELTALGQLYVISPGLVAFKTIDQLL